MGVFEKFQAQAWPFRYEAQVIVRNIHGGTPSDPKVAAAWIRKALKDGGQEANDDLLREQVAEVMADRGITVDEAIDEVIAATSLNGFKKDDTGLYVEGRQIKSCLRESVNIARAVGKIPEKWGTSSGPKKGAKNYWVEHVQVEDDRVYLGVTEPDGIDQRFIHSQHGSSISYEEYVAEAKLAFVVSSDAPDITDEHWAMVWLTAEKQGIGASRSQGYGTFEVVGWEKV